MRWNNDNLKKNLLFLSGVAFLFSVNVEARVGYNSTKNYILKPSIIYHQEVEINEKKEEIKREEEKEQQEKEIKSSFVAIDEEVDVEAFKTKEIDYTELLRKTYFPHLVKKDIDNKEKL